MPTTSSKFWNSFFFLTALPFQTICNRRLLILSSNINDDQMGAVYLIDEQINFNFESFQEKHYWAMQIYGSKVLSLHRFKINIHFITDSRRFNN